MNSFIYVNYQSTSKEILDNFEEHPHDFHILFTPEEAQIQTSIGCDKSIWVEQIARIHENVLSDENHPLHKNVLHVTPICDFNNIKQDVWKKERRHIKFGGGLEWRQMLIHSSINYYAESDLNFRKFLKPTRCFSFLAKKPRAHRIQILDRLIDHDLIDHGFITFASMPKDSESFMHNHYVLSDDILVKERKNIHDHYHRLNKLDQKENYGYNLDLVDKNLVENYEKCAVDIVSETDVDYTVISEKCIRPLIYGKPFVVMGHRHNYHLKEMGFELFTEFFDYDFENRLSTNGNSNFYSNTEVLDPLMCQIKDLCKQDPVYLIKSVQEKIEHNYSTLVRIVLDDNTVEYLKDTFPEHNKHWGMIETRVNRAKDFLKKNNVFKKYVP